jgi:putative membrane protein
MHMHFILRYLGTVAAFILTVYLVPGLVVTGGWQTILLAALVWSVIVMVIRPILRILTLPITILTFGIFSLILNALLFWGMSFIVPGFHITTFLAAFLGAIVLSIFSWLIHLAL